MELLYTILFISFIFTWFSKYNFITFILFLSIFNLIRNVRLYMITNNIVESPNPFLTGIKYIYTSINWVGSKLFNGNSYLADRIPFVKYLNDKYCILNTHFLELLKISKIQTLQQFSGGFNYTLTTVLNPFALGNKLEELDIPKQNNNINLNVEYKKRNEMILELNSKIMPTLANVIESINKLKEIKNNNSPLKIHEQTKQSEKNIYLYDSDNDNEIDNKEKVE
jgi:hypothetical protein